MPVLASLQALRGLAALGVVMFHAVQWSGGDFAVGAAGVDVFFVVSGFIIWTISSRPGARPGGFLLRRALRVWPPYAAATLLAAGLAMAAPAVFPNILVEPWHLAASLLLIPHPDPAGLPFPLLPVGWTLIYEVAFYVVVAAGLWLRAEHRAPFLIAVVCWSVLGGIGWHPAYLYVANLLLFEFLAGAWLAHLWTRGALRGSGAGWGLISSGLFMLAAQHLSGVQSDFWRPLLWGGPAVLIVAGALFVEGADAWPAKGAAAAALRRLGDASFSLYLVHTLVISALERTLGADPKAVFIAGAAGLSLAAGLGFHRWVEAPLLRALGVGGPAAGAAYRPGSGGEKESSGPRPRTGP